ncbi:MAG: HpcH/HpaI aldolase/citrate lyase family protein [Sarcina sp.]
MKYFDWIHEDIFYKKAQNFNKFSDKNILKFAVGANLYMNGLMNIVEKISSNTIEGVGCITICFEDSIRECDVENAMQNILSGLDELVKLINEEKIKIDKIPLLFIRVRNIQQFRDFTAMLTKKQIDLLTGFVFPKFDTNNAIEYINHTKYLINKFKSKLYIMPILESEEIIYKETRLEKLLNIKEILDRVKPLILNIRVGGTDFSSKFGLRRSVNTSIYDIRVVSDCLIDIINIFSRESENYIISGPVWEYFSEDINSKEIKGLLNELYLDGENGFFGKTIIHPTQTKHVNISFLVEYEEFIDAKNILGAGSKGGVFKGFNNNKMNEVSPHYNWAKKIIQRSEVFGVLKPGICRAKVYFYKNKFDLKTVQLI